MEHWSNLDFSILTSVPVRSGKDLYDDNIYTLDFEVSNVFFKNGKYFSFDYNKPPKYYADVDKFGILYIWQFSINENVYYGRTLEELLQFIQLLRERMLGRIIIYIHNLAYEFQFLRNIITDLQPFARKPRHPIYARSETYNIEFRCSLMLTNLALEKLPKEYSLTVEKKTGQLDYNKLRLPVTPLTDEELEYCEYDCIVLYQAILKHKLEYEHVFAIPYTQTGRLRKVVKQMYQGNTNYYKRLSKMLPTTFDEFNILCLAYSGGYTHANALYTRQIINNVHSMDITSSYPTVMVAELFPMSKFVKTNVKTLEELTDKYSYIIDITFYDLQACCSCTYLSKSKAVKLFDCIEDNGRVVTAVEARYIITDVDMKIIQKAYKFDYVLNGVYMAFKDRLDTNFVKYILELYETKTKLKGLPDKTDAYMKSKQYINAMYGMTVTNTVRDDVIFTNEWSIKPLTVEDIENKLVRLTQKHRTFLNYSWGVWVTAYARFNLWSVMLKMSDDVVYCDTDSIKFINDDNFKHFNDYNIDINNKLINAITYHGIEEEKIKPLDKKGIIRPLGVYDYEGKYDKFITLGAKKYCDMKEGELEITVSGVNKHKSISALNGDIKNFKEGMIFDYEHSGRLILEYNDEQPEMTLTDYLGNTQHIIQKYGINAMPTSYTLGISMSYDDYLIYLAGNTTTHLSKITGEDELF